MNKLAAALLIALPFLPTTVAADTDYAAAVTRIVETHAKPAYQRLAASAAKLADILAGSCGEPNGDAAGRTAFHEAVDAWQAIQHIRGGPAADADRHSRIMFWPDERAVGSRQLNRFLASADSTLKDISGGSVALQGFPALERLIYGKTPLGNEPLKGETLGRCAVATAIGRNIAAVAKELEDAINTPQPFGVDPKTAVKTLFSDLVTSLQVVYQLKLRAPAGEEGKTKPRLAENWRSSRALRNVQLNLVAMKEFYAGLYGPGGGDDPQHRLILDQFDVALNTAQGLGKSVGTVLKQENGRLQIRALASTVDDIRGLIAVKLTERLDVNLGFNALDGD